MTAEVTGIASAVPAPAGSARAGLALRLALRDLRGGMRGFRVFLACLALGVGAVALVLSIARAFDEGVAAEGRFILGGDVSLSQIHQPAGPEDRRFMEDHGQVSETASLRAMARAGDGGPALVEVKAVDGAYPLYGTVALAPDIPLAQALARADDLYGVVVAEELLTRLDRKVGDTIEIGDGTFAVRAVITSEPDRLAGGLAFGPRALLSLAGLEASGLVRPGSLIRWTYRIALGNAAGAKGLAAFLDLAEKRLEPQGWRIRSRERATPGIERFAERLTLFLSLIGLTALVVGGVGIANATAAHLDSKSGTIATLKCLGAPARLIFRVYLIEVLALAGLGVAVGLVVGAGLPLVFAGTLQAALPLPARFDVYAEPLAFAAACGFLTAVLFSLWPLGRAQEIAPAALFRDIVMPARAYPRVPILALMALAAVALSGLVIIAADDRKFAAIYVAGAAASFVVLMALGRSLMWLMRRLPRPRWAAIKLGLANLSRPGAATPAVVLSLGLGLTLLVMVGLIDANLQRELASELPAKAPSFFFLDIQKDQADAFDALIAATPGVDSTTRVPMLRGHIVKLNGVPASEIDPESDGWVLRGDRGVTYAATPPDGTEIVTGKWWPEDYDGPQLVSFADEPAKGLGLKVGDTITVNVLGRDIDATIASTRDVNWRTLNVNFVMVFSPGVVAQAPHTFLASVTMDPDGEAALVKRVAAALPNVTAVRVKDALEAVGEMLANLMLAIRAGAVVAIATGALVLGGAIAAGRRARIYDAVVLKTFGATRWRILAAYLAEFAIMGLITACFAALAGTVAAYFVLTEAMNADFVLIPGVVAWIIALGTAATVAVGFTGTWTALGAKAAPILRSP